MNLRRRILLTAFLLLSSFVAAQLSLAPTRLPNPTLGEIYYQELHVADGAAPYSWAVRGKLPPGISFDVPSATLTGTPSVPGDYRFSISVTDSSRHSASREYLVRVVEGTAITIEWTRVPAATNGRIDGEVEISNPSTETFDLTFIAVAVNEIGRATALGYQRFHLGSGKQKIAFGTTLPRGTYVVHADAVGEIARTRTIRRARLQSKALSLP